jgi:hypothetical protein
MEIEKFLFLENPIDHQVKSQGLRITKIKREGGPPSKETIASVLFIPIASLCTDFGHSILKLCLPHLSSICKPLGLFLSTTKLKPYIKLHLYFVTLSVTMSIS